MPVKRALLSAARALLPRAVRPHRIRGGPLRGLVILASWHDSPRAILGRAEPELLEWLRAHVSPGETWLDVGAHYGYTALALARLVGSGGRVFAFEPVLATAGHLAETRRINGLERLVVVPLALGDEEALTLSRHATPFRGMAQMRQPRAHGEPVYSIGLDRLWPRLCGGDERIAGIKIDVQGMEAPVVRGMAETLRTRRPRLVVEYHAYADLEELLRALDEAGYGREGRLVGEERGGAGRVSFRHARSYEFRPL